MIAAINFLQAYTEKRIPKRKRGTTEKKLHDTVNSIYSPLAVEWITFSCSHYCSQSRWLMCLHVSVSPCCLFFLPLSSSDTIQFIIFENKLNNQLNARIRYMLAEDSRGGGQEHVPRLLNSNHPNSACSVWLEQNRSALRFSADVCLCARMSLEMLHSICFKQLL